MATKRDQLQSHQFLIQRMVSALVVRESDPEQPPFRRPITAAFGGIALAVLIVAGFGVYGMIVPGGSKAWQAGDTVVMEKETGTRYVYVGGRLHPVTNYASALLALGRNGQTRRVSQRSLLGVPRGPLVGIRDAPDALPPASRLLGGAWTLCSEPALDQAGGQTSESVLMIGEQPAGGMPLTDQAMLVEVIETGDQYLIHEGYRHRIQKADTGTVGSALASEPWAKVGRAFVAALPDGQAIAPIKPTGIGQPSKALPDRPATRVGQLFVVQLSGGGTQHYLAERDQLVPISSLQFDIQLAYRPSAVAYGKKDPQGIPISLMSAGQAERQATSPQTGQAPRERPRFVAPRDGIGTVCTVFSPGNPIPDLLVDPAMPSPDPATLTTRRSSNGTMLADRILVPPGTAAVVETMASDRAPSGTLSVVTDLGRNYPLAAPDVLKMLGYEGVQPVQLPAGLVARVPQGSGLDPAAAVRPIG